MRKKFLLHIIFAIFAFVAVWITAYQKVEVFDKNDLRTLSCGWPLKFMVNDQSWRDPPFPWKISCLSGEWGDPMTFNWPQFIADVLVFYAFIIFLGRIYVVIKKKYKVLSI